MKGIKIYRNEEPAEPNVHHNEDRARKVWRVQRRRSAVKTRLPREHHQDTARHQGVKTKGKELGTRSRESRENPKRKVEPLSIRINGDRKA